MCFSVLERLDRIRGLISNNSNSNSSTSTMVMKEKVNFSESKDFFFRLRKVQFLMYHQLLF